MRVLTRDPKHAAKFGAAVEVATGDLDDRRSLVAPLRGVERFFLITARTAHDENALAAAREAGARHVVKISTQEAGWTPVEGHGHWHKEREELIRASGLDWTFLRPSMYMSFALSWAHGIRDAGLIRVAGGVGKLGPVDPRDVAAVAKAALTASGHAGKAYELTGPELLGFSDMAATLAAVTGRSIRREAIPEQAQGDMFASFGLPEHAVAGLTETFALISAGRFAYLTRDVEKATGRAPRSFETWAREHRDAFRPR